MNSRLGSGSFATVHATEQGVIKRIHKMHEIEARTLLAEVAVLRHLHHPHLVGSLPTGLSKSGQDLLLHMQHGGYDLFQLLSAGCAGDPLLLSLRLTQHLLQGMAFLHEQGLIHRDIKPSNLVVDAAWVLRICDFGMVCPVAEGSCEDREKHVVTRWYRAPEVECLLPYGTPIDMWAVGCTVVELLRSLCKRMMPLPLFGGMHGQFSPNAAQPAWTAQLPTIHRIWASLYCELQVVQPPEAWAGLPCGPPDPTLLPEPLNLSGLPTPLLTALVLPLLHPDPHQRLTAAQALERMPPLPPGTLPVVTVQADPELPGLLAQTEEEADATLTQLLASPQNSLEAQ